MKNENLKTLVLAFATIYMTFAVARLCPADARQDESMIRQQLAKWVTAFNSGDLKTAADVWAPDLIGWYPGGPDDTYAQEKAFAQQKKTIPLKYELSINEVIVSGDLAVVRDTWTETGRLKQVKPYVFRSFEIWRRQPDGQWRISRWIDSLPPADCTSP